MKKKRSVSTLTKQLLMEDNRLIRDFIRNYEGGDADVDNYKELLHNIKCNKVGIPYETQEEIEWFVETNLKPMVFDRENALKECYSCGQVVDGCFCIDNEEEAKKMAENFYIYMYLLEISWDGIAEEHIRPYLEVE